MNREALSMDFFAFLLLLSAVFLIILPFRWIISDLEWGIIIRGSFFVCLFCKMDWNGLEFVAENYLWAEFRAKIAKLDAYVKVMNA